MITEEKFTNFYTSNGFEVEALHDKLTSAN